MDDRLSNDDYLDLKDIFDSIKRNLKIFLLIFFSIAITGLFYALFKTKTWQGEFQIVLRSNNQNILKDKGLIRSEGLLNAALNRKNDLKTEVEVLKSPSTLMSVFEYVKNEKKNKKYKVDDLSFKDWSRNLKIILKDKTNILDLKYEDSDKDIILPVLNRISKKYENYSNKARLKSLTLAYEYLSDQVQDFRIKSRAASKKAQEFAIDNGLLLYGSLNGDRSINGDSLSNNSLLTGENLNFNNTVSLENKLKKIEYSIKKIDELKNNSELIPFISKEYEEFESDDLFKEFGFLEAKLSDLRSKFVSNDISILSLNLKREELLKTIKERLLNGLKAERLKARLNLEADKKSKEVLLKYKDLQKDAKQNEITLMNLEKSFAQTSLELKRNPEPWKLITKPTLNPYPVAPNKKRVFLMGIIIGIFAGATSSVVKDTRSSIIYNYDLIKKLLDTKEITNLGNFEYSEWSKILNILLKKYSPNKSTKKIGLLKITSKESSEFIEFNKSIKKCDLNNEILITENTFELNNCDLIYIVTSLGIVTKEQIQKTKEILYLQNKEIIGSIILS